MFWELRGSEHDFLFIFIFLYGTSVRGKVSVSLVSVSLEIEHSSFATLRERSMTLVLCVICGINLDESRNNQALHGSPNRTVK
jgi:hypothetical protein